MINSILGVDETGVYESTLNLLSRLKLSNQTIEVVHVEESRIMGGPKDFGFASEFELAQLDFDENLVQQAVRLVEARGFQCSGNLIHGSPAKELITYAVRHKADLIGIGSQRRSKFNSSLFGSMGRALAIAAKQSILISKGTVGASGPLTVLLTTDHSAYSDKAIRLLMKWKPSGIERMILLTTFDRHVLGHAADKYCESFKDFLTGKSRELAMTLSAAGIPTEFRIIDGDLGEVVEAQMDECKADLLVMGAQGQGFLRALMIGSSSLKQVVASRHSVLILRP